MKTNKKLYSAAWVAIGLLLSLIFISSAASAATTKTTETRITTDGSDQIYPDIYGNGVVWQDDRNGNWDIYMYNLSNKKEIQITKNMSDQTEPAIWGDKIVWLDKRNSASVDDYFGGFDIYMYNVSTKKETRITKSTIPINPDTWLTVHIDGNKIVWGPGGEGYDIYVYDLSTRRQQRINSGIPLRNIAFSGNRIVGTDDLDGREGIVYMYDLSTSAATPIIAAESAYGGPDISGNRIVWPDIRNSGSTSEFDLYMYDLSTSTETRITTSPTVAWCTPSIYGNRVVWEDIRDGGSNIYMYDISASNETRITTSGSASNPSVYTPRVGWPSIVWQDSRNGNWDIYIATTRLLMIAPRTTT